MLQVSIFPTDLFYYLLMGVYLKTLVGPAHSMLFPFFATKRWLHVDCIRPLHPRSFRTCQLLIPAYGRRATTPLLASQHRMRLKISFVFKQADWKWQLQALLRLTVEPSLGSSFHYHVVKQRVQFRVPLPLLKLPRFG